MQIFEKSLSNNEFQKDLKSAVDKFNGAKNNFYYAENALRIPLTIFRQSAELQEYSYPKDANLE